MERLFFIENVSSNINSEIDYFLKTIREKAKASHQTNFVPPIDIIVNKPAVIVFFADGTKTIAKCHKKDKFSLETGISICLTKKLLGSNNLYHELVGYLTDIANEKENK